MTTAVQDPSEKIMFYDYPKVDNIASSGNELFDRVSSTQAHSVKVMALSPCSHLRDLTLDINLGANLKELPMPYVLTPSYSAATFSHMATRLQASTITSAIAGIAEEVHAGLVSLLRRPPPTPGFPHLHNLKTSVELCEPLVGRCLQVGDRRRSQTEFAGCITATIDFMDVGHATVWEDVGPHDLVILSTEAPDYKYFLLALTNQRGKEDTQYLDLLLSNRLFRISNGSVDTDNISEVPQSICGSDLSAKEAYLNQINEQVNTRSSSPKISDKRRNRVFWQVRAAGSIWQAEVEMALARDSKIHTRRILFDTVTTMDQTAEKIRSGNLFGPQEKLAFTTVVNSVLPYKLSDPQLLAVAGIVTSLGDPLGHDWIGVRGPPGTAKTTLIALLLNITRRGRLSHRLASALKLSGSLAEDVISRKISVVTQTNAASDKAIQASIRMISTIDSTQDGRDAPFTGRLVRMCNSRYFDRDDVKHLFRYSVEYHTMPLAIKLLEEKLEEIKELRNIWDANKQTRKDLKFKIPRTPNGSEARLQLENDLSKTLDPKDRPDHAKKSSFEQTETMLQWLKVVFSADVPYDVYQDGPPLTASGQIVNETLRRLINETSVEIYKEKKAIWFHTAGMMNPSHEFLLKYTADDVVIIDEAGMVLRSTVGMVARQAERLIAIGDERQLPPYTRADRTHLQEQGLSLLTAAGASPHFYNLNFSFRLHPLMTDILNRSYYKGILESPRRQYLQSMILPHFSRLFRPLTAIDVTAPAIKNSDGSSANVVETQIVRGYLGVLDSAYAGTSDRKLEVAVLSLYRYQARALEIVAETADVHNLTVQAMTVEKSQGKDVDVVILSMVVSGASGSENTATTFANLNRINVAVSRARSIVLLVGDLILWRDSGNAILFEMLNSPYIVTHDFKVSLLHALFVLHITGTRNKMAIN